MFKRYGLLILVVGVVLVFSAGFSRAWLLGDFQIPAKKVKPQPVVRRPAAASRSGSGTAVSTARARTRATGQSFTESVTGMEFVWVPAGCFQMGSPFGESKRRSNEGPVHKVCVDGFWMGKYEVTNAEYRQFKSGHDSGSYKGNSLNGGSQPVDEVSWEEATAFAEWLSWKSGRKFRLPTEAEWEYACRAGTTTARFWGDGEGSACSYANVNDLTSKRENNFSWANFSCDDGYAVSAPVGSFKANRFGLYDMLGNVWEWCADWYDSDYYSSSPERNPQGPGSGSSRVFRGGGWDYDPGGVRSADRFGDSPGLRNYYLGFRLVSPGRH